VISARSNTILINLESSRASFTCLPPHSHLPYRTP